MFFNVNNPYMDDPDVLLMLEFKKGDPKAFEELMRKYFKRVLNFIYRYTGNKERAEDLTQDVFMKVYKTASHYQPKSKLQTWLFTIAKNVSLNEVKRHNRTAYSLDATLDLGESSLKSQLQDSSAVVPGEDLLQEEKVKMVKQAIGELPDNQRTAVLLRRYENFSYEEIAQAMNTSEKAVKSLLNRAKENLKEKLSKSLENNDLI